MAAQVLPAAGATGGSFLDSPAFNPRRTMPPPNAFMRMEREETPPTPIADLNFDSSDLDRSDSFLCTPNTSISQAETPDSGFCGLTSNTSTEKTPESEHPGCMSLTPTSGGSSLNRKRKTVNFDESQTSVVVISPDDLFNTYSKQQEPSFSPEEVDEEAHLLEFVNDKDLTYYGLSSPDDPSAKYVLDSDTGWPLRRSESLESRDNPFLPGGDLCREAEDLLSRATIIRDNFYLNVEEKKALMENQVQEQMEQQSQELQKSVGKHVQIVDQLDGIVSSPPGHVFSNGNPSPQEVVEEQILPQLRDAVAASPSFTEPPKVNGTVSEAPLTPETVTITVPDSDGHTKSGNGAPDSHEKSPDVKILEKKRPNKCCNVM